MIRYEDWECVTKFEESVAQYAGSKYAVAMDCCTHSIFLCLQYLKFHDLLASDVIEVPKYTYISVPSMIVNAGLKIKFTDEKWVGRYQLKPTVIVDAAHRFTKDMYEPGTYYCLSFATKKRLKIGKGGMILTDDKDAVEWLQQARYAGRYTPYYSKLEPSKITVAGWHMHMTQEQAIRGIEILHSLPDINKDTGHWNDKFDLSKCPAFL